MRILACMLSALLIAPAAIAQSPPAPKAPPPDAEVVVTARPLAELRDDWQACIQRGCPPKVEMARAMAYAEAQLVEGEYRDSWRTLRITKQRNLKHAEDLPLDVARIARASSRMAGLNGEPRVSRVGAIDTLDILRAGLDSQDARVLLAKLDIGDAFVPELRVDAALKQYGQVGKEARRKQLPAIAAEAQFRRAALLTAVAGIPGGAAYSSSARSALGQIIRSTDPAMAKYRDPARLVALNLRPLREQKAGLDALLPNLAPRAPEDLLLAYAPPIDTAKLILPAPARNTAQQWVDIRYHINADGAVSDLRAVRRSPHLEPALLKAALTALGERRYAPLALAPNDAPAIRYARYTFVFDAEASGTVGERSARVDGGTTTFEAVTRIPRYKTTPRVDVFDLGTQLVRSDAS